MTREAKLTVAVAVLGWLVALGSLGLNLLTYLDSRDIQNRVAEERPTYSLGFRTFDPDDFPAEVLALTEPVKHSFTLEHRSGRKVEGVVIELSSDDVEISDVTITEGVSGTGFDILNNGTEARLSKAELLPSQEMKGFITTKGVTELNFDVAADVGSQFVRPNRPSSIWSDYEELSLVGLFLVVLMTAAVVTWYLLKPALEHSGIIKDLRTSKLMLAVPVLLAFALTSFIGVSLAEIFYLIMIIVVVANYKRLTGVLDKYLSE